MRSLAGIGKLTNGTWQKLTLYDPADAIIGFIYLIMVLVGGAAVNNGEWVSLMLVCPPRYAASGAGATSERQMSTFVGLCWRVNDWRCCREC